MENSWLEDVRKNIDRIDSTIIDLLAERFEIVHNVGEYKKKNSIPMMQKTRVEQVLERCCEKGERCGFDRVFIKKIFTFIIDEACRRENEIIGK